jgi:hypothetical protein
MMRKMNGWEIHLARQKREWYPGAVYHVMSRGNRRLALFKDDEDYLDFLFLYPKDQRTLSIPNPLSLFNDKSFSSVDQNGRDRVMENHAANAASLCQNL